ncbi:hypothetical protein [Bacillus litorisediminis]|uniref:hypothetical protein n=1 Tax=Bacillus litorisediminis TaxID=2922713 RepID=UPI001FAE4A9C|nr:hypothetical protein [Bacillus litorisediminis]
MQLEKFIDRRKSHSVKWYLNNDEIIPLCIADMDFQVSEEIRSAFPKKRYMGYTATVLFVKDILTLLSIGGRLSINGN